jgi:hypothetical protein
MWFLRPKQLQDHTREDIVLPAALQSISCRRLETVEVQQALCPRDVVGLVEIRSVRLRQL